MFASTLLYVYMKEKKKSLLLRIIWSHSRSVCGRRPLRFRFSFYGGGKGVGFAQFIRVGNVNMSLAQWTDDAFCPVDVNIMLNFAEKSCMLQTDKKTNKKKTKQKLIHAKQWAIRGQCALSLSVMIGCLANAGATQYIDACIKFVLSIQYTSGFSLNLRRDCPQSKTKNTQIISHTIQNCHHLSPKT